MNRMMQCLLLAMSLAAPAHASAQTPSTSSPPVSVAADPKDVASGDAIIAALYDANSVMVDQTELRSREGPELSSCPPS